MSTDVVVNLHEQKLLRYKARAVLSRLHRDIFNKSASPGDVLKRVLRLTINYQPRLDKHLYYLRQQLAKCDLPQQREYLEYEYNLYQHQADVFAEEAKRRLDYYLQLAGKWEEERQHCEADLLHYARHWAWLLEPRNPVFPLLPFIPFPVQAEYLRLLVEHTQRDHQDLLVEKSRAMGASWGAVLLGNWRLCFSHNAAEQYLYMSLTARDVDSLGNPSSLFEKNRVLCRLLPPELVDPNTLSLLQMRHVNLKTGVSLIGAATKNDTGRSARCTAVFIDEAASIKNLEEVFTALSQTTNARILISTPRGENYFYDLRQSGAIRVFTLHWRDNPYLNDTWYGWQKSRMSSAAIAQELDIQYQASTPHRVFPQYDERYHVVTWSEVVAALPQIKHPEKLQSGEYVLPEDWLATRKTDWAHGMGKSKNVTLWIAVAPSHTYTVDGVDVSGMVFVVGEYVAPPAATPRIVATEGIFPMESWLLRPQQVYHAELSHERPTEAMIFNEEYSLSYTTWRTGYVDGIARLGEYLDLVDGPHPFRPLDKTPRMFFVVWDGEGELLPDGSVARPASEESWTGLGRTRKEIVNYRYDSRTTSLGVEAWRPVKVLDDAMDCLRAAALTLPAPAPPPKEVVKEETLPALLQAAAVMAAPDPGSRLIDRHIYLWEEAQHKLLLRRLRHRRRR